MGTPQLAADVLERLHQEENLEIVKVITQPDRPAGRKKQLQAPPVRELADELELSVEQPANKADLNEILHDLPEVDFYVVLAYGMILDEEVLELPRIAPINVHFSLLPKYRGASPIHEAILHGDQETGISIIKMEEKLDAGPVYLLQRLNLSPTDDLESLTKKLTDLTNNILPLLLQDIYDQQFTPLPQEGQSSYCRKIKKSDGAIDWNKSAIEIFNMIRAYKSWPTAHTEFNGKKLKILEAQIATQTVPTSEFKLIDGVLHIGTGHGSIIPISLQPEGKQVMDAKSFTNGYLN